MLDKKAIYFKIKRKKKIKYIFNLFLTLFFYLSSFISVVYCAIHTVGPLDCSSNSINSAISKANDGDIIELVCVGTIIWDSTVVIPDNKGITLIVKDGTNTPKDSANFPLTILSSADPIININCENNRSLTRISGFKFTNTIASKYGAIKVSGRGTGTDGLGAFRIDNNYFKEIQLPHAGLHGTITVDSSTGILTGIIDNNTFSDCSYNDGYTIAITEMWQYGGVGWPYAGMNAWIRDFNFGGNDFIFIEDNLFENINRYTRHIIMGHSGAKYIVRYNIFDIKKRSDTGVYTQIIDAHGLCLCGTCGVGTRGGEIYNNIFRSGPISLHNAILIRGGSWLVYDNVFFNNSVSENGHIALREYRAASTCSQCENAGSCPSITNWRPCVTNNPSYYPLPQQISKSYFWNNLYNKSNVNAVVDADGYQKHYLLNGRDFWNCTNFEDAKSKGLSSSYIPYIYPHPLRSRKNSTSPSPPKGLKIQFLE